MSDTNKISDGPITLYGTNIYQVTADFNITILDSKTTNQIISKSYNIPINVLGAAPHAIQDPINVSMKFIRSSFSTRNGSWSFFG